MVKVAILGLGLIGGSLGMDLVPAGWEVTGYARRAETIALARAKGAIGWGSSSVPEVITGAEVVVLATSIGAMPQLMKEMAPHLSPEMAVTDVGSTKALVLGWAQAYLPEGVSFVGGHPMAGKEQQGLEAAQPGLFRGKVYCLVPAATASPQALSLVTRMALAVRANPLMLGAAEHDNLVAGISHLPLLMAAALTLTAAQDQAWPKLGQLAASGFRDTTRLASGSPEMGLDICLTNSSAIVSWLDRFSAELAQLRRQVAAGNGTLKEALTRAKEARDSWLQEKRW